MLLFVCFCFQLEDGSVDEEFTKSDEEYDDLAMQDIPESGYTCDDDDDEKLENKTKSNDTVFVSKDESYKTCQHQLNMDTFQRSKSEPLPELVMRAVTPHIRDRRSVSYRLRKRSLSINQ